MPLVNEVGGNGLKNTPQQEQDTEYCLCTHKTNVLKLRIIVKITAGRAHVQVTGTNNKGRDDRKECKM
jgi:hypothetical protein